VDFLGKNKNIILGVFMNEIQRIDITLNGNNYQISVLQSENGYTVRGLQNNQIITPSYNISYEVENDMNAYGNEPFQDLIDLVISDLRHR